MKKANLPVFLSVALGGAWLIAVPLWLSGDGISSPILTATASAMMFAPSVAVLVVWLLARRHGTSIRDLGRDTGLGLGPRKRRTVGFIALMWFGPPLFSATAILVSSLVGLYTFDLENLSLFKETLHTSGMGDIPLDARIVAVIMLASILVNPLINAIPSFGEEWGWRGFLMPRLLAYGRIRAVLVSGVIWGVWHAPLTLLGYNFPHLGPWAAAMFVPFCVLFGAVLSWTRLVTGSVWPSVAAHGAFNGAAFLLWLPGSADAQPDFALAGPTGLVGLVILAAVAVLLYSRRQSTTPSGVSEAPVESAGTVSVR